MTKWYWQAQVEIARIYVDGKHPFLGAFLIVILGLIPLAGVVALALLRR